MILSELYLQLHDREEGKSSRVLIMSDPVQRASDFRRYAALCPKFAETDNVRARQSRSHEGDGAAFPRVGAEGGS